MPIKGENNYSPWEKFHTNPADSEDEEIFSNCSSDTSCEAVAVQSGQRLSVRWRKDYAHMDKEEEEVNKALIQMNWCHLQQDHTEEPPQMRIPLYVSVLLEVMEGDHTKDH
ncbi:hypothetical protein E2C01_024076 [Portunus trituberculatus]|uniref:Uncharacterized protein n=1 Tax=Portunus trituberculatus TaxID=210409 RepID=A0A5B7EAZ2_PORTR|nr:hypothetical protein [Portunus trituberculatus]